MFMNISNVNKHFAIDGSSAHNVAFDTLASESLAQENGHVDTLKSLPVTPTASLEHVNGEAHAQTVQAVSEGAP